MAITESSPDHSGRFACGSRLDPNAVCSSRVLKTYGPPRLQGVLSSSAADQVSAANVSGLGGLLPAKMGICAPRSS